MLSSFARVCRKGYNSCPSRNRESENGVRLRKEMRRESWLWLLQMEGDSNTITIYPELDLNFSDPQEDKQEAVSLDAEPIHPKEELVVWTQKLLNCYMRSLRLNLSEIYWK